MSKPLLDQAIYKFIDAKLSKDGRITSVDVSKAFGLGRQKVSSVFTKYRSDYPRNMYHSVNKKCYLRGNLFEANALGDTLPETFLDAVSVVFPQTKVKVKL
ncbi:hypothetical protein SL034_004229 [Vibrio harveyi]|uniref:hypothetical protein n=1 Tax=Vibrio harveyi group TaxID=717610 RepID=UPI000971AA7D|nr:MULTISPECIES: hypothetical protein [Vibrio harveyi group]ELY1989141.1 hypothetical protein [Vibrio harveyi]APX10050.1 hypothetical protein BWP24_28080 [Vibrio campbellii]ARR10548.1 hypothetical protein Vc3S01_p40062 [Vibrio campbellii]WCP78924.1 hypothetical protein PPW95_25280 [Vibrio parahaemolyticus]WHP52988.1 hypothetical protein QMY43_25030 [Vibrio parahaemolyticus]